MCVCVCVCGCGLYVLYDEISLYEFFYLGGGGVVGPGGLEARPEHRSREVGREGVRAEPTVRDHHHTSPIHRAGVGVTVTGRGDGGGGEHSLLGLVIV